MGKLVPDYITIQEIKCGDWSSSVTIPVGTFVKPIEAWNLPRHIKVSDDFKRYNKETHIYVYCSYGFFCVERDAIGSV